jgi:hypothetical protein
MEGSLREINRLRDLGLVMQEERAFDKIIASNELVQKKNRLHFALCLERRRRRRRIIQSQTLTASFSDSAQDRLRPSSACSSEAGVII